MTTYYVCKENTLVYPLGVDAVNLSTTRFFSATVLAVDYMAGGDPTLINRSVLVNSANAREATEEDYERFKVII